MDRVPSRDWGHQAWVTSLAKLTDEPSESRGDGERQLSLEPEDGEAELTEDERAQQLAGEARALSQRWIGPGSPQGSEDLERGQKQAEEWMRSLQIRKRRAREGHRSSGEHVRMGSLTPLTPWPELGPPPLLLLLLLFLLLDVEFLFV